MQRCTLNNNCVFPTNLVVTASYLYNFYCCKEWLPRGSCSEIHRTGKICCEISTFLTRPTRVTRLNDERKKKEIFLENTLLFFGFIFLQDFKAKLFFLVACFALCCKGIMQSSMVHQTVAGKSISVTNLLLQWFLFHPPPYLISVDFGEKKTGPEQFAPLDRVKSLDLGFSSFQNFASLPTNTAFLLFLECQIIWNKSSKGRVCNYT